MAGEGVAGPFTRKGGSEGVIAHVSWGDDEDCVNSVAGESLY